MKSIFSIIGVDNAADVDLSVAGTELGDADCPICRDQLKAGDLALLEDIAQEGTNVRFLVISAPQPDSWLKAATRLNADVVDHIDVAVAVPGGAR